MRLYFLSFYMQFDAANANLLALSLYFPDELEDFWDNDTGDRSDEIGF